MGAEILGVSLSLILDWLGGVGGLDHKAHKLLHDTLKLMAIEFSKFYTFDANWLPSDITIISGAARGADSMAVDWAISNYACFKEFPANWDKYGKSAGYKRNIQMLKEGKPDLVIAFPGGRGTEMMCELAKEAGVEVRRIE